MKLNINDVVALAIKNNTKRVEVRVGKESNEYDFSKLNKNDIIFGTKLYRDQKYIIIASNAIIKYGNEIFFLIDGINYRFKNFNANHLLKWKIIEEYRNKGFTKFHFNGITGDFTRKNKYVGLFTFKKGFNAVVTEYIGEYSLIVNKPKYNLLKGIKPILRIFNSNEKG